MEGEKEGGELVHFGSALGYSPPRQGRDSSRSIRPHCSTITKQRDTNAGALLHFFLFIQSEAITHIESASSPLQLKLFGHTFTYA